MATADRTLVRRAGANLVRGLGGSLPLALLPPLLARHLADDEFAVWVLVVQLASYVTYFEVGIQTAVSKTSASAFGSGDLRAAGGPVSAGVRMLVWTGGVGLVVIVAVTAILPTVFDVPDSQVSVARASLLILGVAAAVALPGSAVYGALLGIGRNGLAAATIVVSRLFSVGVTLVGAWLGWSLPALALALASGSALNAVLPFVAARWLGLPTAFNGSSVEQRREITTLTATFAAFTVSTLLVSGIDVVVVGMVDFGQVAAYGLGASLVAVISAGYTVTFTVLLPAFAESSAGGDRSAGQRLVVRSTTLSSWLLVSGLVVAFAVVSMLMQLWAGTYADDARPVFLVLLTAGIVRLSVLPLVQFIIGVGDHKDARRPAVGEALLNLGLSVALGIAVGAGGVAAATLIAAAASLVYYLTRLGPRALGSVEARRLILQAYVFPGVVAGVGVLAVSLGRLPITIATCVLIAVTGLQMSRRSMTSHGS